MRFAIAALAGFGAGAFVLAALVWRLGNFVGTYDASHQWPADPGRVVERWGDPGPNRPRFEARPSTATAPTTGREPPVTAGAPPLEAVEPSPDLRERNLLIPVQGAGPTDLRSSFGESRGSSRRHEAIDILAPRDTPVLAVDDGTVARLFESHAGGTTIYQFDVTGAYVYYYAHLERYAEGLAEGGQLRRGQVIGYVGTSGNAPKGTPHLHFAIFKVTEPGRWWDGMPLDPFLLLK